MLLIRATRRESKELETYDVSVFINAKQIWEGIVGPHNRADGWPILAGHIARRAGLQRKDMREVLESMFAGEYDRKIADGEVHCPACGKGLQRRKRSVLRHRAR